MSPVLSMLLSLKKKKRERRSTLDVESCQGLLTSFLYIIACCSETFLDLFSNPVYVLCILDYGNKLTLDDQSLFIHVFFLIYVA